jgi:membrane-bound lytic murein transglycosylase B
MTITLKTTILASSALAGLLNLANFSANYNQRLQASFTPSWAESATPTPAPVKAATAAVAPTPQPLAAITTPPPPAPADIATTKLAAAGLKSQFAASYLSVQAKTGTPWQLVAAVHVTETTQSDNTARSSSAGAIGPMQFMPGTWRAYALDGDGNGTTDITDLDDALLTGGRYLAAGGAAKGNYNNALYNYNHSNTYVAHVMAIARRLGL